MFFENRLIYFDRAFGSRIDEPLEQSQVQNTDNEEYDLIIEEHELYDDVEIENTTDTQNEEARAAETQREIRREDRIRIRKRWITNQLLDLNSEITNSITPDQAVRLLKPIESLTWSQDDFKSIHILGIQRLLNHFFGRQMCRLNSELDANTRYVIRKFQHRFNRENPGVDRLRITASFNDQTVQALISTVLGTEYYIEKRNLKHSVQFLCEEQLSDLSSNQISNLRNIYSGAGVDFDQIYEKIQFFKRFKIDSETRRKFQIFNINLDQDFLRFNYHQFTRARSTSEKIAILKGSDYFIVHRMYNSYINGDIDSSEFYKLNRMQLSDGRRIYLEKYEDEDGDFISVNSPAHLVNLEQLLG